MPGTRPMRRTTMRRRLLPVRTLTALLMVMFSRLTLFTSVILSPTHSPACSARGERLGRAPKIVPFPLLGAPSPSGTRSAQPRGCRRCHHRCGTTSLVALRSILVARVPSPSVSHLPAALPSSTLLTKMPSPCSEPPRTLKPSLPSALFSTVMALITSLSLLLAAGTAVSPGDGTQKPLPLGRGGSGRAPTHLRWAS
uniref:Uncharacterized protein n=1 Tax=Cairina moschata TaxID=8855 RepID=A0A8C3GDJ1_CAIMO